MESRGGVAGELGCELGLRGDVWMGLGQKLFDFCSIPKSKSCNVYIYIYIYQLLIDSGGSAMGDGGEWRIFLTYFLLLPDACCCLGLGGLRLPSHRGCQRLTLLLVLSHQLREERRRPRVRRGGVAVGVW